MFAGISHSLHSSEQIEMFGYNIFHILDMTHTWSLLKYNELNQCRLLQLHPNLRLIYLTFRFYLEKTMKFFFKKNESGKGGKEAI
jgi:hypothetical protein